MEKIQQGNLLMATIEYPEAITSVCTDHMNLNLIGLGKSGMVYRSNIGLDTNSLEMKNWKIEENPEIISFSPDGNEIITASDRQINIFAADSQANIRNIFINKKCLFFFSVLDTWNISQVNDSFFNYSYKKTSRLGKLICTVKSHFKPRSVTEK